MLEQKSPQLLNFSAMQIKYAWSAPQWWLTSQNQIGIGSTQLSHSILLILQSFLFIDHIELKCPNSVIVSHPFAPDLHHRSINRFSQRPCILITTVFVMPISVSWTSEHTHHVNLIDPIKHPIQSNLLVKISRCLPSIRLFPSRSGTSMPDSCPEELWECVQTLVTSGEVWNWISGLYIILTNKTVLQVWHHFEAPKSLPRKQQFDPFNKTSSQEMLRWPTSVHQLPLVMLKLQAPKKQGKFKTSMKINTKCQLLKNCSIFVD